MWFENSNADEAFEAARRAEQDGRTRRDELLRQLRLYSSKAVRFRPDIRSVFRTEPGTLAPENRFACNIVHRIVDHARNKVCKSWPAAKIITSGGGSVTEFDAKQRAQELERLIEGAWYHGNVYAKAIVAATHCMILGTGALKVIEHDDRVSYEWVFPGELHIPEHEQTYGEPRELWQSKYVDRLMLAKRFPRMKSALEKAPRIVEVWEGWHLAGRHVMLLPNERIVLVNEPWEHDAFPFAFMHFQPEPAGFWADGLAHLLLPYQYDINVMLRTIRSNVRAGASLKVVVERGSVALQHVDNIPGTILEYASGSRPPAWIVNPTIEPTLRDHLLWTIGSAWEESGFNQAASSSQKPTGLNSGVALRTWDDQQTERQALLSKAWERMFLDLAKLTIDAAQRIYQRTKKFEQTWPGKSELKRASMRDAMLDSDLYEVRVFSSSRLPDTPSGRLEFVQELTQAGLLTEPATILRLLDFPDIESELADATAAIDAVDARLAAIVRDPETAPFVPHELLDLQAAQRRAQQLYCRLEVEMGPEPDDRGRLILDRVRVFYDQCAELLSASAAPMMEAQQ